MPQWIVKSHSEREVCYASYYDITDQVPAEYQGPNGTIRFKHKLLLLASSLHTHHVGLEESEDGVTAPAKESPAPVGSRSAGSGKAGVMNISSGER